MAVKGDPVGPSLFRESATTRDSGSVECLGMTFESEEARRGYFLDRLKEKLPELRQRPDFPVGEDADILRLSDPPYYTACPNPFLTEFIKRHGRPYDPDEPYHREPFAVDVSVGKTDPGLQGARLPHQGAAFGDRPVNPPLHKTGRRRPGRILRHRNDRRRGAMVRHGTTGLPP